MRQYFDEKLSEFIKTETNSNLNNSCYILECLRHYPKHLYKYRDCMQEYNFEMIEEGYLWADIPQNYDDPTDALINLKLSSELSKIQKWMYSHIGEIVYYCIPPKGMKPSKKGQSLQKYVDCQSLFMDSCGRFNAPKAKKLLCTEMKKLSHNEQLGFQKMLEQIENGELKNKMEEAIKQYLLNVVNNLRKNNLVCCLTQRGDNQKMWEEYAHKYTGFVIEYELFKSVDIPDCVNVIFNTFPVKYYKRMPKVPLLPYMERVFLKELYNKNIDIHDTEIKLYKQLLIKREEYSVEEEWRVLSSEQKIAFPLISAVYMGYKISDEHEQRLKIICKKKNIPLYKQEFNPIIGKMGFKLVKNS